MIALKVLQIRSSRHACRMHMVESVTILGLAGSLVSCALPTVGNAQAVTVSGGVGMLGVASAGYVGQLALTYDAHLRAGTRWWAGLHAGRDPNPGIASPGMRQSVSELILSVGPLLPIRLTSRSTVFVGAGAYGVVRRYGVARAQDGGPPLTSASSGGGDWGALGRAAVEVGLTPRWGVMLESQLRIAAQGSTRRQQPAFSAGLRRQW